MFGAIAPDDSLHLTVHFIRDVPAERLPHLKRGLAVPAEPTSLRLDRFDVRERGIAVLTPSQVPNTLLRLHFHLGEALRRLGLPVESRPFRPHVTLARRASGAALNREKPEVVPWRGGSYLPAESAGGPYLPLKRFAARY